MTTEQSTRSLTDLPSEIVIQILARLPLRTLLVSRSVCKSFLFLTTPNLHFIDYAATGNSDPKPFFHLPKMGEIRLEEENRFSLVNSCNGLVYLRDGYDRSLVCNPVTNEYIIIPAADLEFRSGSRMWLGFSPGTNQYKVLRISSNGSVGVAAQVFVIGSDTWRDIDATHVRKNLFFCGPTIVNGVGYWHQRDWADLVSFDFERDKFGKVALPAEFRNYQFRNKYCTSTGVLGDCLCVSCNDFDAYQVHLWVMRNQNSWTKEFVFDTVGLTGKPVIGWFKPLQFLRNGEVLIFIKWIENDLVCYDPRTETLRYFGLLKKLRSDVAAFPLTPSFVPLKDTLKVDKVMNEYVRPRGDEKSYKRRRTLAPQI